MKAIIQRVKQAQVDVNNKTIGQINQGILILLGVEQQDTQQDAEQLAQRIINYRIFNDDNGKMNLNLEQIQGKLLVISQFTLAADTSRGRRPSFSSAATPQQANTLYQHFVKYCQQQNITTATGEFGADMQVSLINDGPVTFALETKEKS
ncbi:D-tyrosyl-tRNA(Tyr) deacylase [Shewanella sp. 202IG2-18]|uniref:D-aminoacyl-tRNA deacylase n=1 Tax=Parashewanella hymeniacidonis TaxID=2807618 RepID=UPI00195F36AE|nr:D-aminoacyl-tRNA deacylase [Parashewanella hymeniacidonis]MBM7071142.1 D-tyrosyl-tRNA(Tyr) deacylase [Parashewanella hymeniacidonis]